MLGFVLLPNLQDRAIKLQDQAIALQLVIAKIFVLNPEIDEKSPLRILLA